MMARIFCALALLLGITTALHAQDISGDWQGAIGAGKDRLRVILHVDKVEDGGWKATFFSLDEGPDGTPVDAITEQDGRVKFSIAEMKLSYRGSVSSDGQSIVGRLTQDGTGAFTFVRATKETAWARDIHCSCSVSFVPVEKGVKDEVLDWGGTGRPLVLLAGLGDTAHGFDKFAQKLIANYHVYGITRRGYGESSSPSPATEANYSADRLGDDVLAVIDALHLARPVLAGHSIAGEELSSVGSRHPERVAGLVYLDAAYGYAFYDRAHGDLDLDALEMRKKLGELAMKSSDEGKAISDLLAKLAGLEKELRDEQAKVAILPTDPPEPANAFGPGDAILLGQEKYSEIKVPALAIFASPHHLDAPHSYDAAERKALANYMSDYTKAHVKAFEVGVPSAHVVEIPNADHYVFQSNEADVLREMNAFIATLPN